MPETKELGVDHVIASTLPAKGYAAMAAAENLRPFAFERRTPGPHDVLADILYCGICHTDLHFIRNDWGMSMYPMVPGHEIIGRVTEVGDHVKKFKVGDAIGIGCLVDSCRECDNCKKDQEQYCQNGFVLTYSSYEKDAKRLGAHKFVLNTDEEELKKFSNYFDFILDTVSAPHDYNLYLGLLKTDGAMVCVGLPTVPAEIPAFTVVFQRRSFSGSLI